jgi:hypothetical protein
MFGGDAMFSFPANIFAAGAWLIVASALAAGLGAWAVVEVLERVRRRGMAGRRKRRPRVVLGQRRIRRG